VGSGVPSLLDNSLINPNSNLGIPFDVNVKVPRTLPTYVESSDQDKLYAAVRGKEKHKKSIFRDLTLLRTADNTGMCRSERANLRVV